MRKKSESGTPTIKEGKEVRLVNQNGITSACWVLAEPVRQASKKRREREIWRKQNSGNIYEIPSCVKRAIRKHRKIFGGKANNHKSTEFSTPTINEINHKISLKFL